MIVLLDFTFKEINLKCLRKFRLKKKVRSNEKIWKNKVKIEYELTGRRRDYKSLKKRMSTIGIELSEQHCMKAGDACPVVFTLAENPRCSHQ